MHHGADPSIVGKTISLNNHTFNVVGVAPKGFVGTEVAYAPAFWAPIMMAKEIEPGSNWLESRDSDNLFMIGRLKPGVTVGQAKAALDSITLSPLGESEWLCSMVRHWNLDRRDPR
jgi:hypothetical protein